LTEIPIDIAFSTFLGRIIPMADMESKAINPPLQSAFAKTRLFCINTLVIGYETRVFELSGILIDNGWRIR